MITSILSNAINKLYELMLTNYAGKKYFSFTPSPFDDFMPDYLGERKQKKIDKSLEEQEREFKAFHAKLKAMIGKNGT